jgi:hypothetical protein
VSPPGVSATAVPQFTVRRPRYAEVKQLYDDAMSRQGQLAQVWQRCAENKRHHLLPTWNLIERHIQRVSRMFTDISAADWDFPTHALPDTRHAIYMGAEAQTIVNALTAMENFGRDEDALRLLRSEGGGDWLKEKFRSVMLDQRLTLDNSLHRDAAAREREHLRAVLADNETWNLPLGLIPNPLPPWHSLTRYRPENYGVASSPAPRGSAASGAEMAAVGFSPADTPPMTPHSSRAPGLSYPWSGIAGPAYLATFSQQRQNAMAVKEVCEALVFSLGALRVTWLDYMWALVATVVGFFIFIVTVLEALISLVAASVRAVAQYAAAFAIAMTPAAPFAAPLVASANQEAVAIVRNIIKVFTAFGAYWSVSGNWLKNFDSFLGAKDRFVTQIDSILNTRNAALWQGGPYDAPIGPGAPRVRGEGPTWFDWSQAEGPRHDYVLPYAVQDQDGDWRLTNFRIDGRLPAAPVQEEASGQMRRAYEEYLADKAERNAGR